MKNSDDYLPIIIRGIAHDLNNILTITMGNISLCELYIDDDKEKLKSIIKTLLSSCKRAQELISQLNLVSNFQSSKKENIPVLALLKHSVSCIGTTKIDNIYLINNSNSINIQGDPEEFRQIFLNLILNSLQAIEQSQRLKIILDNTEFEEENSDHIEPGYYLRITFQDNGAGISEENQAKIFKEKFTTKETGTGLGLIISKLLIQKNNGYINFNSKKNTGTTFNIYFRTARQ